MKGKLVDKMREQTSGLMTVDAQRAVDQVFAALPAALESHGRITIPGFGAFTLKSIAARPVRNPKTGAMSTMEAHRVVKLKGVRLK